MSAAIGYVASHERFPVPRLLETTALAERVGFDAMWASDHFHPWQDNQGHAGHAWLTLAALTERTASLLMGTGVTCPTYRNNPVNVAHAFASLGVLAPGRIFLGVGAGEALNEIPSGGGWGRYAERAERLVEAITIIRALWSGDWVTFEGRYHRVRNAHLFDRPSAPIPIYVAANGPKTARLAGRYADGLIPGAVMSGGCHLTEQGKRVFAAFEEGAREAGKDPSTMPKLVEMYAVLGDIAEALEVAPFYQFSAVGAAMLEVADCREIRRIAVERTTPHDVLKRWIVSPDPDVHAQAICTLAAQGFTHIFVHAPQTDHRRFLDAYGRDVLPAARRAMGAAGPKGGDV